MSVDDFVKIVTVLSPIILAMMVYLNGRQAKASADKAAVAAGRVEDTLESTTSAQDTQLTTIHTLVNNRLTEALAKIDRLEERLYHETGESPTGEPPQQGMP